MHPFDPQHQEHQHQNLLAEYLRGSAAPTEPTKFIQTDVDQWWQPEPPRVTFDDLVGELRRIGDALGQAFEQAARPITQTFEAMKPILEVTEGHHIVCEHKPRCRKPPPWASMDKPAAQQRRRR